MYVSQTTCYGLKTKSSNSWVKIHFMEKPANYATKMGGTTVDDLKTITYNGIRKTHAEENKYFNFRLWSFLCYRLTDLSVYEEVLSWHPWT